MAEYAQAIAERFPPKRSAWIALENHYRKVRHLHLRDLFAEDSKRGKRMSVEAAGIYLDYSKNRITDHTIKLLTQLAVESGLQARIDAMFRGEMVNITQNRAALHVALRSPRGTSAFVDGQNVAPHVQGVLDKMRLFCNRVRRAEWKGHSGKRIRNIVNIGSGPTAVGPNMAYEALKAYSDRSMTFRFVANVDSSNFAENVRELDPSETLFIICSRSFTGAEIMTNACSARAWIVSGLGGDERSVAKHFVAVSQNADAIVKFGVEAANLFPVWDWVGDHYSIESAVGLSTMLAVGPESFRDLLNGFHQMDMHFLATPFDRNIPVLIGLLTAWYVNFFGVQTIAVLPYEHYLSGLPAYLQQLTMGSNGKRITLIGTEVTQPTGPVYWGETGTTGHHSFYQLIHQGTGLIPCDFIAFAKSPNVTGRLRDELLANAFAQSEALAFGKSTDEVKAEGTPDWLVQHRVCDGNRPSNTILAERLTPETLGGLIALYEHAVFTQGVIWNINPFDEWGVEFGEELAQRLLPELETTEEPQLKHDSSTNALIHRYRRFREAQHEVRPRPIGGG
jgi:glucose-6-phosphate isomerase